MACVGPQRHRKKKLPRLNMFICENYGFIFILKLESQSSNFAQIFDIVQDHEQILRRLESLDYGQSPKARCF